MALKHSYTIIAPFYDAIVSAATHGMRKASAQQLNDYTHPGDRILIGGIGTGLDIPHLPHERRYVGIDITPAMLKKAERNRNKADIQLRVGDVMELPFEDASFDAVLLHLILAVAPHPLLALQEAQRVVKQRGYIFILDKFLKPDQRAPIRRLVNPVIRHVATQTTVVFEQLLAQCPQLHVVKNEPALAAGWFRRIVLQKDG
ncbi:MAG: class I SAM-dependent methyltransferase [Gammaproteobacteria bacterium]|jgi:ubiquinone/menaquinone biosynthesis C-methylase UbiE